MKPTRIAFLGVLTLLLFSCRGPEFLTAKVNGQSEVSNELKKWIYQAERKFELTEHLFNLDQPFDVSLVGLRSTFRENRNDFDAAKVIEEDGLISKRKLTKIQTSLTGLESTIQLIYANFSGNERIASTRVYSDIMNQVEGTNNRLEKIRLDVNNAVERNKRYVKIPLIE